MALIADAVCEAARDGASYAAAEAAGYRALGAARRRRRRRRAGRRVEVEALFADGSRLIVLHDPIRAAEPPPQGDIGVEWLRRGAALTVVNEGDVAVGVTSHFHFFEVNRALRFDRARGLGHAARRRAGREGLVRPGHPAQGRAARPSAASA